MSKSFADTRPNLTQLSPSRVTYGGVDLGGTLGNVLISTKYEKAEKKQDQLGVSPIDRVISGMTITVTTELTQVLDKEQWKVAFPNMLLVEEAGQKSGVFKSQIGNSDQDVALPLLLHPLSKVDADKSDDFLFFKAVALEESEITYGPDEQARLKVVWNIYPDFTTLPAQYYVHGDPAIGLVSATASSPSFTGAGNGTMTGVAVFDGQTLTEQITAECISEVPNGGIFQVEGSVSGPLGNATVGSPFVSDKISFTINDGSNDFEDGDTFTVNTVASNYQ